MYNNFTIRTATIDDAEGIATVHVKTWKYAYKGHIPDQLLQELSIEDRAEHWKRELANLTHYKEYAYVAEVDDVIVGWCTGGTNRDDDMTKEIGELYGIYVLPEYEGKGIGSKLMKNLVERLKQDGYKEVSLWVLTSNNQTRKWYETKQWKIEGKTKIEKRGEYELPVTRYIREI